MPTYRWFVILIGAPVSNALGSRRTPLVFGIRAGRVWIRLNRLAIIALNLAPESAATLVAFEAACVDEKTLFDDSHHSRVLVL